MTTLGPQGYSQELMDCSFCYCLCFPWAVYELAWCDGRAVEVSEAEMVNRPTRA